MGGAFRHGRSDFKRENPKGLFPFTTPFGKKKFYQDCESTITNGAIMSIAKMAL
jgi:hypothetical protein